MIDNLRNSQRETLPSSLLRTLLVCQRSNLLVPLRNNRLDAHPITLRNNPPASLPRHHYHRYLPTSQRLHPNLPDPPSNQRALLQFLRILPRIPLRCINLPANLRSNHRGSQVPVLQIVKLRLLGNQWDENMFFVA